MADPAAVYFFSGSAVLGAGLLLWGRRDSGQADVFAAFEPKKLADLALGDLAAVEGVARSPVSVTSGATGSTCLFYIADMEVLALLTSPSYSYGSQQPISRLSWQSTGSIKEGGFFIEAGEARAFVFPFAAKLALKRPSETRMNGDGMTQGDTRVTETLIESRTSVTVLGKAAPLSALLAYVRQEGVSGLPPELLSALEEEDRRSPGLLCFFSPDPAFYVADRPYAELLKDWASSASTLLWSGAALLAMGLAGLAAVRFKLI